MRFAIEGNTLSFTIEVHSDLSGVDSASALVQRSFSNWRIVHADDQSSEWVANKKMELPTVISRALVIMQNRIAHQTLARHEAIRKQLERPIPPEADTN